MPANLFLMWILPLGRSKKATMNGLPELTGSFFWATTKAGERSDLLMETRPDNENCMPNKRPSWQR